MKIIIHPYEGIEVPGKGRISFGMTRQQVRAFFHEPPIELLINETDAFPKDIYCDVSLHLSYSDSELLEFIEIAPLLDPVFQGKHLLRTPYQQAEAWFKQLDRNIEIEEDEGFTSHQFGIGLWAPNADQEDPEYIAESVFLFEKGYYTPIE
jgi:hypothetical protein